MSHKDTSSIVLSTEEALCLRGRLGSEGIERIPGITALAAHINSEPPVIPVAEDLAALQSLLGLALREEVSFVESLWQNGRGVEAVGRLSSPLGLSAIHSTMARINEAGVPLQNFSLEPPKIPNGAWL